MPGCVTSRHQETRLALAVSDNKITSAENAGSAGVLSCGAILFRPKRRATRAFIHANAMSMDVRGSPLCSTVTSLAALPWDPITVPEAIFESLLPPCDSTSLYTGPPFLPLAVSSACGSCLTPTIDKGLSPLELFDTVLHCYQTLSLP